MGHAVPETCPEEYVGLACLTAAMVGVMQILDAWTGFPMDFPWEQHHCLESSIRSIRPATAAESWSETTSQKGHKMRPTFCPTHLSRRNLRKPHARSYSPRLVQHCWGGAFSTCTMLGFCRIVLQFGCPSPYHFGELQSPGKSPHNMSANPL